MMNQTTEIVISPERIRLEQSPYVYSYGGDLEALIRSIRESGLLQPPLVIPDGAGGYDCVAGSRRIRAWQTLSGEPIPARRLPVDTPPSGLFLLAIADNQGRVLNLVECGRLCLNLKQALGLTPADMIREFLPRLGHHPSPAILERLLLIPELPDEIQRLIAAGDFPLKNIPFLSRFQPSDRELLGRAIAAFHLSSSRQQQVLEMCWDLHRGRDLAVAEILGQAGAWPPPAPDAANLPQLAEAAMLALHCRRWPTLHRREKAFRAVQAGICADRDVRLQPFPFFERQEYRLEMVFRDPEHLRAALLRLLEPEQAALIEQLFQPLPPPLE